MKEVLVEEQSLGLQFLKRPPNHALGWRALVTVPHRVQFDRLTGLEGLLHQLKEGRDTSKGVRSVTEPGPCHRRTRWGSQPRRSGTRSCSRYALRRTVSTVE